MRSSSSSIKHDKAAPRMPESHVIPPASCLHGLPKWCICTYNAQTCCMINKNQKKLRWHTHVDHVQHCFWSLLYTDQRDDEPVAPKPPHTRAMRPHQHNESWLTRPDTKVVSPPTARAWTHLTTTPSQVQSPHCRRLWAQVRTSPGGPWSRHAWVRPLRDHRDANQDWTCLTWQMWQRLPDDWINVQMECACHLGIVSSESIKSCVREIRQTRWGRKVASEALENIGTWEITDTGTHQCTSRIRMDITNKGNFHTIGLCPHNVSDKNGVSDEREKVITCRHQCVMTCWVAGACGWGWDAASSALMAHFDAWVVMRQYIGMCGWVRARTCKIRPVHWKELNVLSTVHQDRSATGDCKELQATTWGFWGRQDAESARTLTIMHARRAGPLQGCWGACRHVMWDVGIQHSRDFRSNPLSNSHVKQAAASCVPNNLAVSPTAASPTGAGCALELPATLSLWVYSFLLFLPLKLPSRVSTDDRIENSRDLQLARESDFVLNPWPATISYGEEQQTQKLEGPKGCRKYKQATRCNWYTEWDYFVYSPPTELTLSRISSKEKTGWCLTCSKEIDPQTTWVSGKEKRL